MWALAKDYGKSVVPSGPVFKQQFVEGDAIRLADALVIRGLIRTRLWSIGPPPLATLGQRGQSTAGTRELARHLEERDGHVT